jgi:hypothetical protein
MNTAIKTLIAAALTGTALFTALPASADGRDWDRHDRHEWRDGRGHDRHWRHGHRHYVPHDRVVIRERPVYRNYYYEAPVRYYAPPVSYYEPPVRYRYARDPAIVVGVNIPPLVIPLR